MLRWLSHKCNKEQTGWKGPHHSRKHCRVDKVPKFSDCLSGRSKTVRQLCPLQQFGSCPLAFPHWPIGPHALPWLVNSGKLASAQKPKHPNKNPKPSTLDLAPSRRVCFDTGALELDELHMACRMQSKA